jgi:hypothetical protein
VRIKVYSLQFTVYSAIFLIICCALYFTPGPELLAQEPDLEFTLDVDSATSPLPKIFRPNLDLSGRGFHRQSDWPQALAAQQVVDRLKDEIGLSGFYRLQYNLWEISQLARDKEQQAGLLRNYEEIIKAISNSGGIIILDIFSTPAGLGKVLDKKSPPLDTSAFKELIKGHIRNLSCVKKYNIWYEVWSAPDLDNFFLGRKQEYLALYRAVAEAVKELSAETKIHIPLGGPGISWWFQNVGGNNINTPERSLIYELIKFCYHYRLPLDFVTWHGYSTDPRAEKETTIYNKTAVGLIRDWLLYFKFDKRTPLIVDEWNYDRDVNVSPERSQESFICASYIPNRIKNMYEAGVDNQLFFSLEDFQNNREGVVRNTGVFWFDPDATEYKGGSKAIYTVMRMLASLGENKFELSSAPEDESVGVLATKGKGYLSILIYNYIDSEMATNFISRGIGALSSSERKALLGLIRSARLPQVLCGQTDISTLRLSKRTKTLLSKAKELNERATKFKSLARDIKLNIKNLKDTYLYERYVMDSSCSFNCKFMPAEEKEVAGPDPYQERLSLSPYSVNFIILRPKPKVAQVIATETKDKEAPAAGKTETPAVSK